MRRQNGELSEYTRGLIEGNGTRAVLIAKLAQACEEHGIDMGPIAHDCFFQAGAEASKDAPGDGPDDFIRFMTSMNNELFDKEVILLEPDHAVARFHFCPLYAKWKQMGLPPQRIDALCRLANLSDCGRASNFRDVELTFPKRLGGGDEYCELDARKNTNKKTKNTRKGETT